MPTDSVLAWFAQVTLSTYDIRKPEKHPCFLDNYDEHGRHILAHSHPVREAVADPKQEQPWAALFLENRYLKIMILPELGGRVQMALDKTNDYHFDYCNRAINPPLVSCNGSCIAGKMGCDGQPSHGRSAYRPINWQMTTGSDGSKTIWCAEWEALSQTKRLSGFRLYPDRAYLEVDGRLYNASSVPQSCFWGANLAFQIADAPSIPLPDLRTVMAAGPYTVAGFPRAATPSTKADPALPGAFVCDSHTLGLISDRAYSVSSSWIMAGEEKCLTQIFLPCNRIGGAKHITKELVANLTLTETAATIELSVTQPCALRMCLLHTGNTIFARTVTLTPADAFTETVTVTDTHAIMRRGGHRGRNVLRPEDITLQVFDAETSARLAELAPRTAKRSPTSASIIPAMPPAEIISAEELFLNGLHLEQSRHATYAPEAYYEEALRRDPLDSRCNNALGLLCYRRGQFAAAIGYFHKAIESLTRRSPNPHDGEPFYNLGLALTMQGEYANAVDAFSRATGNGVCQAAAYVELARLACRDKQLTTALELVTRALHRNWMHHQARHLKIAILRRLQRIAEAQYEIKLAVELDATACGAYWEAHLLAGQGYGIEDVQPFMGQRPSICIALALDYCSAGLWQEAIHLLTLVRERDPMAYVYLGWCHMAAGQPNEGHAAFAMADRLEDYFGAHPATAFPAHTTPLLPTTLDRYDFPDRLEAVLALQCAIHHTPKATQALYLLGTFWYAQCQYEAAILCWERARALDPTLPAVHRQLALAYMNQRHDSEAALTAYETAFACDITNACLFFELDQLYKLTNVPPQERLINLELHDTLVTQRADLSLERINLLNLLCRHDEAADLLLARPFPAWAGSERKARGQYVLALVEQAKTLLREGKATAALSYLHQARHDSEPFGKSPLSGVEEHQIFYCLGCAYTALGEYGQAEHYYYQVVSGANPPRSAFGYHEQPPEMLFYQALARRKLGDHTAAELILQQLIDYGDSHLEDTIQIDYFAVALPARALFDIDLNQRNRVHCLFMSGLGCLGLGMTAEAIEQFNAVLALRADHQGAALHKRMVTSAHVFA